MILLIFLTKVIICSAVVFGYYFFFLRNKKFHQYNRYYLVIGVIFSFLFPLLQIPILHSANESDNVLVKTLNVITVSGWEDEFVMTARRNFLYSLLTFQNIALAIYLAGFTILFYYVVRFFKHIRKLSKIYTREQMDKVTFYNTREPGTPFSFFNSLFWNEKISLTSEKGQQILRHELFHIKAKHSYDIIFMKCMTTLFWFNPFYHLFMKEIKAIHEFLADEHASNSSNKYEYAELLVTEAINNKKSFLSNHFFHNQIKRRITMIIKNNPSNFSYARRIMTLPLLLILFCAFALKTGRHQNTGSDLYNRNAGQVTVVIDAGHGGIDAGAQGSDGITEKELTLSIARKVKELSGKYNINVVLTRENDDLPGNASNAKDGLLNRMSISEKSKADLFVSIHLSAKDPGSSATSENGFDIYVSGQNKQFEKSKLLASAISGEIKKTYKISDVLKESNAVWVLKSGPIPAILIECGFITDKTDLDFITKKENQEKIANDILRGIGNYHLSNSTSRQKAAPDTMPASELALLMQNLAQKGEAMTFTSDSKKDLIVVKLANGDSLMASLSEFMKQAKHYKPHSSGTSSVSTQKETEPSYPGGAKEWMAYLNKNFRYPKDAIKNNIEGTIIVKFLVGENGKVSEVEATTGPKIGGLREEAMRLIQNSGSWLPAIHNGQPVKSYKTQPFTYKLTE